MIADPVLPGESFVYPLTVHNDGPNPALQVRLVDTLPPGVSFRSAAGADCTESPPGVVTCQLRPLLAGASREIELQVQTGGDFTGTIANVATVENLAGPDADPSDNTASPPIAIATSDATLGVVPFTVNFNGSQSSDPEGGALQFAWDFDDSSALSMEVPPTHEFVTPATYLVRLAVTDDAGQTALDALLITAVSPRGDFDEDGISNSVDVDLATSSLVFDDRASPIPTRGFIASLGDQTLTIEEAPDPSAGVLIRALGLSVQGASVLLDFESLAHTGTFVFVPSHSEGGFTITSDSAFGNEFVVFGTADGRFTGSTAPALG